jgi:putative ABC transport system permease protein
MRAIPLAYCVQSVRRRYTASLVAILGIAGAVGVFVAMLALARGFKATLQSSGLPENAIVRRAGADSEMTSIMSAEDVRVVEDAPEVAWRDGVPLVSGEIVVIAAFPLRDAGSDANVQVRGVSPRALLVRPHVRVSSGRFFRPGLHELVVGSGAAHAYAGLTPGASVAFGGSHWTVVGVLDAGGSAFDSELWCDADVLASAYQRPRGVFQSATARLRDPAALEAFAAGLARDPRLQVQVMRETDYYTKQSELVTALITVLGSLVALVMGVGAVFGALNTMLALVAARRREIAVLRALGFGAGAVVLALLAEAVAIALLGGLLGCLAALPVSGLTTGTVNWQTFSHLAFAFRVTPDLLAAGLLFAAAMGVAGGLPPALRAARAPVAAALRAL